MEYDVAIVGSGLTGSLMALALSQLPLKVVLIEAKSWRMHPDSFHDLRSIALSYGSRQILKALGIWEQIDPVATPILDIHVSNQGRFGMSRLNALDSKVPALGYIVELMGLLQVLWQAVNIAQNVTVLCPAEVIALTEHEKTVAVHLNTGETLEAKLVLAADGTHSPIRKLLNIDAPVKHYQQSAIITNVGLHFDHRNVAYERFTPQGPLALLPLSQRRVALVWSMEPKLAEVRKNLSEAMFLAQLQQAFGYRLGRFAWVGGRQVFSLSSLRAKEQVKGRVLLLGNAAHSLHPVAGQGFNLTLQDIAVLAELLSEHQNEMDAVQAYLKRRAPQQHKMQAITDNLVGFFSRGEFSYLQSLGLTHLERLPALKREFAKVMMGMDSHLPRLARGLSLKGGSHAS